MTTTRNPYRAENSVQQECDISNMERNKFLRHSDFFRGNGGPIARFSTISRMARRIDRAEP
jgi:hypothetical protein